MDPYLIAIVLYLAALAFAFIDIFIPSGGMLIVLAVVAGFASILFGFRSSTTMGMSMLTIVAATVPAFAYLAINIWPHTPIGKRMILHPPSQSGEEIEEEVSPLQEMLGKVIRTESALMPSGQIKVGYRRLNAIMENGIAEAGQVVKVIDIRERNLIMRLSEEPLSDLRSKKISVGDAPQNENLLELTAEELGLDSIEES